MAYYTFETFAIFREHKFYVKDFVYNEDNIQQEKGQLTKLNQVSIDRLIWILEKKYLNR